MLFYVSGYLPAPAWGTGATGAAGAAGVTGAAAGAGAGTCFGTVLSAAFGGA